MRIRFAYASRIILIAFCLYSGATAVAGGVGLVTSPHGGGWLHTDPALIARTPFDSFLVPGLLLAIVVGGVHLFAAAAAFVRYRHTDVAGFAAGATMAGWLVGEVALLREVVWLQAPYLVSAAVTMAIALAMHQRYARPSLAARLASSASRN